MRAYLGLGGNQGDPVAAVTRALEMIEERGLGKVVRMSSWYRTEPVGMTDQPWFVNACAEVEPLSGVEEFIKGLFDIEAALGRPEQRVKDGPRPIDIDLLLWGDEVISEGGIEVPHPRMHARGFVLVPLVEIAPHAVHPVLGKSVQRLLEEMEDRSEVKRFSPAEKS